MVHFERNERKQIVVLKALRDKGVISLNEKKTNVDKTKSLNFRMSEKSSRSLLVFVTRQEFTKVWYSLFQNHLKLG